MNGLHPVANMIAPFFAHFALANSFAQYMIRDVDSGRERMRWPPCLGTTPILSSARAPIAPSPVKSENPARLRAPGSRYRTETPSRVTSGQPNTAPARSMRATAVHR
ncbi:hypothetical protein BconGalA64_00400 [Burkholderia contaminans]|nr:hypothetical protein BconGalA64_00400 [Burkholderia contaminans]